MKLIILLSVCILLSACKSTPVNSLKTDIDMLTEPNAGYFLLGVDTTINLKSIEIDGPSSITLSHNDLAQGNNLVLLDLRAGKYTISRIYLDNFYRMDFEDEEYWEFEIKPLTISYVGHLEFKTKSKYSRSASVELVNRSTEAVDYLIDFFPKILQSRDLYYGGPGEDVFFDYINVAGE